MAIKLFVGGLSWGTTDETLNQYFSQIGPVATASVIKDKFTGRSRGFGFVEMANDEDAKRAIAELNGKDFEGRTIVVNEARPPQPREDRGGRSYGGGGGYNRGSRSGGDDRGGRNW
jgi:RNA recognition motif-containing protein